MATRPEPTPVTTAAGWNRRRFLQASAMTAAGAAVLAACSTKDNPTNRIGTVPTTSTLPPGTVTDVTLLRTTTSLEQLLLSVYKTAADNDMLAADDQPIATKMHDQHEANAATLAELTTDHDGVAYHCPNERMMSVYIEPALQYILGSKQAATLGIAEPATEIPPSTDIHGDTRVLLNALEVISAATYQAYVAYFNDIELRAAGMTIGVEASRRGALWGALINPDALVDATLLAGLPTVQTTAAPTTALAASPTTAAGGAEADVSPPPVIHAVSASFGQLDPVLIELGVADENGIRQKVNLETPYLNAMVYEYEPSACPA